MDALQEILSSFNPISLEETECVKLMNRTETKYTFLRGQLCDFLQQISKDYKVLEINNNRANPYQSLYFDTPTYQLYLLHHNNRENRYKIRYRHYTSSGDCFFEIKHKTNKNRTEKNRVETSCIKEYIEDTGLDLIKTNTTIDASKLIPSLWVYFSRITLVNNNLRERLTIDVDISFKKNGKVISYPEIAIAEVKQDSFCHSKFDLMMKNNYVRTKSISKYCFGLISTKENIKMNNFKHNLMIIKKLYNEN
ncbi:MAG: polyphosphate polymerase domain-containing protein [Bacteroidota bacterium]